MSTISISKQLFKFFCSNAVPDQVDQAYAAALNVYGASVANALEMWRDNLKVAGKMLTAHPDGATRFDVCAITGILQECEIGRVEDAPVLPPEVRISSAKFSRCFVSYDAGVYKDAEDAEANGALYYRDPVGQLDTFTTLFALQAYELVRENIGNTPLAFGFVTADLVYVSERVLSDAVQRSDDKFLAGLCKCAG